MEAIKSEARNQKSDKGQVKSSYNNLKEKITQIRTSISPFTTNHPSEALKMDKISKEQSRAGFPLLSNTLHFSRDSRLD